MTGVLDPPEPTATAAAPSRATVWWDWARHNLFRSAFDAAVTVVSALVVGYIVYRLGRFVLVTGRWEIVRRNLTLFLVGRYPRDELWRPVTALVTVGAFGGLLAGFVHARQRRVGAAPHVPLARRLVQIVVRLWPLLLGVLLLLALARTVTPWFVAAGVVAAVVAGRIVGARLPRRALIVLIVLGLAAAIALFRIMTAALDADDWGGMMLNVVLAVISIALSFPIGVLLALGRRSKLPLIRIVCTVYIEIFRGVPLFVLLLLSATALGFFVPPSFSPSLVVRAVAVFTLFTAAYVAEIVRGGLQALPRGQTEAARALGLPPWRVTFWIVLPQALRNVIPALVGQFISLFKDTTLAGAAMGFLELFAVADSAASQAAFRGQGLYAETATFILFLFWVGSITMSRESQRLERKLGVGER